jgi:hypothetical protein
MAAEARSYSGGPSSGGWGQADGGVASGGSPSSGVGASGGGVSAPYLFTIRAAAADEGSSEGYREGGPSRPAQDQDCAFLRPKVASCVSQLGVCA